MMFTVSLSNCSGWLDNGMCFVLYSTAGIPKAKRSSKDEESQVWLSLTEEHSWVYSKGVTRGLLAL